MYIYFVSIQYTQYTPTAILTPSGKVAAMPGPKSLKAALVGANMVKGPTPAATSRINVVKCGQST